MGRPMRTTSYKSSKAVGSPILLWRVRLFAQLRKIPEVPMLRTQIVLTLGCCAVAAWSILTMLLLDIKAYTALPVLDYWDFWRSFLANGYHPKMLFALHNEHRILLPRISFMVDHLLFHATGISILVTTFVIQVGQGVLLWRIGRRASGSNVLQSVALGSLVMALLFSARQVVNFTQPFQIVFVEVCLLETAAMYALMQFEYRGVKIWFVLSLLLAWCAAYTMANGLLLWPVLLLLAVALHLRWAHVGIIAANGAAAFIVYFHDWVSPPQHISPLASLFNPPQALAFALAYLGSPIDDIISDIERVFAIGGESYRYLWPCGAGLLGVLVTIVIALRLLQRRYSFNRAQILLLHNLFFILITALVTGIARGIQFGLGEALGPRYSTPPLVFWSCLLLLLWSMRARRASPAECYDATNIQMTLLVAIFLLVTINQTPRLDIVRHENFGVKQAEAAIAAPVFDEDTWKHAYFLPQAIIPLVDYFRQQRLSIFREEWTHWPGKSLRDFPQPVSSANVCLGSVDEVTYVPANPWPGYRITGWAWDRESKRGPDKILIVDQKGIVAGVGLISGDRPDVIKAQLGVSRADVGWEGYVPAGAFQRFDAYMLRDEPRTICKIGSLPVRPTN
jgi:hypothetical protein